MYMVNAMNAIIQLIFGKRWNHHIQQFYRPENITVDIIGIHCISVLTRRFMMKIMISAVGGSVAISYIQHLQKLGHYVVGIDMKDDIPGKHFCDEFHKVDPCHPGYISDIDYDLFFPFIDEELLLCMNDKRIIQCDHETNMTCINKHFLYQYCISHAIKVPALSSVMDKYGFVRGIYSRGSKEAFLIIDFTKDIVSKIKFKGPINIQCIVRDNEIYLIEINPRLAGSAIFSIMAGFDIIKDSIDIWTGNYYKSDYNIKDKKKVYRYLTEWSD